jgi:hypothetical protein
MPPKTERCAPRRWPRGEKLLASAPQHIHHDTRALRVKRSCRLVGQDNAWPNRQRAGYDSASRFQRGRSNKD